eukprot:TRINITY_DN451_c1_g1_i1.p1 TRINITY_DN451_c1_g1~~TRINITY_DN451_c1_g1_i1.p1  ORF type:complete len:1064 (-),score=484.82 TRINITY_DN451_c1_g1_i1:37-2904(-)
MKRTTTAHFQFLCMQDELSNWIQNVLEDQTLFKSAEEFSNSLKDGVILCNLMNKISPGSISKQAQPTKAAFKMMEHAVWFTSAVSHYGVKCLFTPNDLVWGSNMMSVLATLYELAELASEKGNAPPVEKSQLSQSAPSSSSAPSAAGIKKLWERPKTPDNNKPSPNASPNQLHKGIVDRRAATLARVTNENNDLRPSFHKVEQMIAQEEIKKKERLSTELSSPPALLSSPSSENNNLLVNETKEEVKNQPKEEESTLKEDNSKPLKEEKEEKHISKENDHQPVEEKETKVEIREELKEEKKQSNEEEKKEEKKEELAIKEERTEEKKEEEKEDKKEVVTKVESFPTLSVSAPSSETESESEEELESEGENEQKEDKSPQPASPEREKTEEELSKIESFRLKVIEEIISTERDYVKNLHIIVKKFRQSLQYQKIVDDATIQSIFSNVDEIQSFNAKLLSRLEERVENSSPKYWVVGDIFEELADEMFIYSAYCTNKENSSSTLEKLRKDNQAFSKWLKELFKDPELKLDIGAYLVMPVQRLCRYPLLLRELIKNTHQFHVDHDKLEKALKKMEEMTEMVNESKRYEDNVVKLNQIAQMFGMEELSDDSERMFIKEGELVALQDIRSTKPRGFLFVLFSDLLIFGKPPRISKRNSLSLNRKKDALHVVFKGKIEIKSCTVSNWPDTSYVKYGFQISNSDGSKLILGANSQSEKDAWMKSLVSTIQTPSGESTPNRSSRRFSNVGTFLFSSQEAPQDHHHHRLSANLGKAVRSHSSAPSIHASSLESYGNEGEQVNPIQEEKTKLEALLEWKRQSEEEVQTSNSLLSHLVKESQEQAVLRVQNKKELQEKKDRLVEVTMQLMAFREKDNNTSPGEKKDESWNKKVLHDSSDLTKQLNQERKTRRELAQWKDELQPKMEELEKKLKAEADQKAKLQEKYDKLCKKMNKAQQKKAKKETK